MSSVTAQSEDQANLDLRIGVIVKRLRQLAGLTQSDLAARVNVSQGCISLIECGHRNRGTLNLMLLQSIARELGYNLSDLIRFAEKAPFVASGHDAQVLATYVFKALGKDMKL